MTRNRLSVLAALLQGTALAFLPAQAVLALDALVVARPA